MNNFRNILIAAAVTWTVCAVMFVDGQKLTRDAFYSPKILIFISALLALAMVIEAYLKERAGCRDDSVIPEKMRALVFGAMIVVYVALLEPVGYFIVTPLFLTLSYLFLKAGKPVNMLLLSVGLTVFVYFSFVYFLQVPVPMGPLS